MTAILLLTACSGDPARQKQRYLESGNRYFEQAKYSEAIIEYRNAIQIDARFGEAHAKLAEAYTRQGDPANALPEYIRAADSLPNDNDLQLAAGNYLLLARHPEDARTRAEAVLAREPQNVRALVLLGNAFAGLEGLEKAIAKIEEAIKLDPKRSATYTNLGALEAARGRRNEAETAFKRAAQLEPTSIAAHLGLANYYWAVSRLTDAEASFQAALQVAPKDPLVNRALAVFFLATGRAAEAEGYLKVVAETSGEPSSLLALIDYYLATNRPKEAITRLEPLTKNTRIAKAATLRLARAYATIGQLAKAQDLADQLLKGQPRDAQALLLKGELLFAEGKKDQALERVKTAAETDPTSVQVQFTLGKLFAGRGDLEAAQKAFSEVLRLNPRATVAEIELSRLHLVGGATKTALSFAQEAVSKEPENLEARLALLRGLVASGDIPRAETEMKSILATNSHISAVHTEQGILASAKKDLAGARRAFERALEIEPQATEPLAGLVALDLADRKIADAKARVDQRLNASPRQPGLLLLAARVSAAAGDLVSAESRLRHVIDVDPTMLQAYASLGQLYLAQRKLDEARKEFEALAERQARPVGALTMAGIILQAQGNVAEATKRFEKVLAIDRNAPIAANNLAWIYAESGENLDVALQLAQTATTALPDSPEINDTLGWIFYKKKLGAQAVAALSRSVEKTPQQPTYRYHLGLAYLEIGDETRARESLERALALSSDFAGALHAKQTLAELATPARPGR